MSNTPKQNNFNLSHVFEGISKVKLRGGVVGRVCWVLIFTVVAITSIVCATAAFPSTTLIAGIGIISIALLIFTFLNRIISFADKNPEAALLEGAEFIKLEQMRFGMKSSPVLPTSASAELVAPKEDNINPQEAALPDVESGAPSQLSNG